VNKDKNAQHRYVEINEAYETLGNEQKRSVYDATGMSSNDQQNTDFNFDGFTSFGDMFRQAWGDGAKTGADDSFTNKTYEQILAEYEKFFSLDEEMASSKKHGGQTRGANIHKRLTLSFAETITGIYKIIGYRKMIICKKCDGKKVKANED